MDNKDEVGVIPVISKKDKDLQDLAKTMQKMKEDPIFAKFKPKREHLINKLSNTIAPDRLLEAQREAVLQPKRVRDAINEELDQA